VSSYIHTFISNYNPPRTQITAHLTQQQQQTTLSSSTSYRHPYGVHAITASVRHGYPWVQTDQTHGRPRQVGPTYQKTRRPVSGPNRPSWRPARPPEDLLEDSPDDLIQHDLKTWCTRQRPRWISPEADRRDMARCVT
jgi:hypothetical protein